MAAGRSRTWAFQPPEWAVKDHHVRAVKGKWKDIEAVVCEVWTEPEGGLKRADFTAINLVIPTMRTSEGFHLNINLWVRDRKPLDWNPDDWELVPSKNTTIWERLTEESPF